MACSGCGKGLGGVANVGNSFRARADDFQQVYAKKTEHFIGEFDYGQRQTGELFLVHVKDVQQLAVSKNPPVIKKAKVVEPEIVETTIIEPVIEVVTTNE